MFSNFRTSKKEMSQLKIFIVSGFFFYNFVHPLYKYKTNPFQRKITAVHTLIENEKKKENH